MQIKSAILILFIYVWFATLVIWHFPSSCFPPLASPSPPSPFCPWFPFQFLLFPSFFIGGRPNRTWGRVPSNYAQFQHDYPHSIKFHGLWHARLRKDLGVGRIISRCWNSKLAEFGIEFWIFQPQCRFILFLRLIFWLSFLSRNWIGFEEWNGVFYLDIVLQDLSREVHRNSFWSPAAGQCSSEPWLWPPQNSFSKESAFFRSFDPFAQPDYLFSYGLFGGRVSAATF